MLLITIENSFGQYQPKVKQISIKEGLSDRFVNSVYQDSRGFFWIGCNYGLNRYDGNQVKVYTKENHGLKSNKVAAILELSDSLLLVVYNYKMNPQKGCFQQEFSLFDPIKEEVVFLRMLLLL